jgi:hypothetical protein
MVAVASSMSGLWLLRTFWNSNNADFFNYDPATDALEESTPVSERVSTTPGTGIVGLEVDSRSFWVSLLGNDSSIVRIDATTKALQKLPGLADGGSFDLAWLGDELLVSTATGHVYAVTPPPSWTRREFLDAPDAIREFGVATCGDVVVVARSYGVLSVLNSSGVMTGEITSDEGDLFANARMAGSIAFYRDELVVADTAGLEFYSLTPRP